MNGSFELVFASEYLELNDRSHEFEFEQSPFPFLYFYSLWFESIRVVPV